MANYDEMNSGYQQRFRDYYNTPEGKAAYNQSLADNWSNIQNKTNGFEEGSGGFFGFMEKVMEPVMNKAIKYTPYLLAFSVGAAAAGAMAAGGAAAGAGSAAGEGALGAGIGEGALAGGSAAGASGGATLGEIAGAGGGALGGAGAAGAAEAIPTVVIGAPAAGAAGGGTAAGIGSTVGGGLSLGDILNNSNPEIGNYENALPEGVPIEGTEGNIYPTEGNNNPVFSNSGMSWQDYLQKANQVRSAVSGNNNSPGLGGLLGSVGDYYNNKQNQQYYKGLIDKLSGMYAPGTPEEQLIRQKVEAQDAASGRRSQYGVREMNLAGILAQQRANIMTNPTFGSYVNGYTGRRDNQFNSLLAYAGNNNATGQIGQYANTANNLYNLYDKGSNWWNSTGSNLASSLFGG